MIKFYEHLNINNNLHRKMYHQNISMKDYNI